MRKLLLKIENLQKAYHNLENSILVINNLNLKVYENEIIAIVGPSGCGKSTLLSVLTNLEDKSSGKITFYGKNHIGYMLQTDCLFPWLNIFNNCLIGLKIKKNVTEKNKNYIKKLLKKYGLYDFINQYPSNLSGGMKQRVALIRTLATNPDLLLLDEPYSALDYQTRLALSDDLYQIIKDEKKTAIIITHDIAEAISMADRVIVLSKRPCTIKNIYNIKLENKKTPTSNRQDKNFNYYYEKIWRDLDVHI